MSPARFVPSVARIKKDVLNNFAKFAFALDSFFILKMDDTSLAGDI